MQFSSSVEKEEKKIVVTFIYTLHLGVQITKYTRRLKGHHLHFNTTEIIGPHQSLQHDDEKLRTDCLVVLSTGKA